MKACGQREVAPQNDIQDRVRKGDAGDKIILKEFFNNLLGFIVGKCQVIGLSRSLSGRYPEGIDGWLVLFER